MDVNESGTSATLNIDPVLRWDMDPGGQLSYSPTSWQKKSTTQANYFENAP
jgi:hypothetical protein